MKYSYIVTSNYVSVLNLETGNVTKIGNESNNFDTAMGFVKSGNLAAVEALTTKNQLQEFVQPGNNITDNVVIEIVRGTVQVSIDGAAPFELHNILTERILTMREQGFTINPMLNFLKNLMQNPSKIAVDELYLFLESAQLPITDDGYFIAYKMVRSDYTSIHDSKFMNKVGTEVSMPSRNMVNEDRNNTCSDGLHFCSKSYLTQYESSDPHTDRLLLLKINPSDVVTIPSDYSNAKGRAWKYFIMKDITEAGWRKKFGQEDFTDRVVVETDDDDWHPGGTEDDYLLYQDDIFFQDDNFDHLQISQLTKPDCPSCGHGNVKSKGFNHSRTKRRYKCKSCGHNFYEEV